MTDRMMTTYGKEQSETEGHFQLICNVYSQIFYFYAFVDALTHNVGTSKTADVYYVFTEADDPRTRKCGQNSLHATKYFIEFLLLTIIRQADSSHC